MALRTTKSANRMIAEAVLMTGQIRLQLERDPAILEAVKIGGPMDTGVMAAHLAGTLIATFGSDITGSALFEEVEDAEVPPANLTTTS